MNDGAGRIWLLIRSLNRGGAERQVVLLARLLAARGASPLVVVFYGGGAFELELQTHGVPVVSLEKRGRWDARPIWTLWRLLRREKPTVIYSFLAHGNLASLLAKLMRRQVRVVWGLRGSRRDLRQYGLFESSIRGLQRVFAHAPDATIVNSQAGRAFYLEQGFPAETLVFIPNGIDSDVFVRDSDRGASIRRSWNIGGSELLLGIVGRLEPSKGHVVFLRAASKVVSQVPNAKFVCIGRESQLGYGAMLKKIAADCAIADRVVWAGESADMRGVYSALDGLVVASESEGFPNVIAEAMSCGTPCVSRRVGDAADVIGDTGVLVRGESTEDLVGGMIELLVRLGNDTEHVRAAARDRIVRGFGGDALVTRTLAVLRPTGGGRVGNAREDGV